MKNTSIRACLIILAVASAASADTRIDMPLPPNYASAPLNIDHVASQLLNSVSSASATTVLVSAKAPQPPSLEARSTLFSGGIEALERYSAKSGQTRNHSLPIGFVTAGGFQVGGGQYYTNYEGPYGYGWGWGWGGPIIINNNFGPGCGRPPRCFSGFDRGCGVIDFTGIGVF